MGIAVVLVAGLLGLWAAGAFPIPRDKSRKIDVQATTLDDQIAHSKAKSDQTASTPDLPKANSKEAGGPPSKRSGWAELEHVEAHLNLLNYSTLPARDKQRKHALQELKAAMEALEVGKTGAEVTEHLDRVKKDITNLRDVATAVPNQRALDAALKELEAAVKNLKKEK
jgi:hypothetical protein